MRIVYPHYYRDFECIGGDCPDTCCAGWQIVIDDESLERYEQYVGHFAGRLDTGIDWNEGIFKQKPNGACCMLNDQGLCDMILSMGEDHLCKTCALYPRHVEEFEGLREWSLSISCPVAAHMVLSCPEPVRFIEEKNDDDDPLIEDFEDFDFLLFTELEDAREVIFRIVQNRELPMSVRIAALMEMSNLLQTCLEENRISDMQKIVEEFALDPRAHLPEEEFDRYSFLEENFSVLTELELLREDWQQILNEERDFLAEGEEVYNEVRAAFVEDMKNQPWWDIFRENYLMTFIYTYFCGAVYDDWIDTKILLGVFSLIFTEEFIMNQWRNGGITQEDCERIAYRYVREVEHSDLNLNTLEEFLHEFLFSPA